MELLAFDETEDAGDVNLSGILIFGELYEFLFGDDEAGEPSLSGPTVGDFASMLVVGNCGVLNFSESPKDDVGGGFADFVTDEEVFTGDEGHVGASILRAWLPFFGVAGACGRVGVLTT